MLVGEQVTNGKQESSKIIVYDSNYNKIEEIANLEDGFWGNSAQMYKDGEITEDQLDQYRQHFSLDETEYIDIDNDGKMEIILNVPTYEGVEIEIFGYKNGNILYGNDFETVEVFKFDEEKSDAQDCKPYILLYCNENMLFAEGENTEAESTVFYAKYKINSDNSITLSGIETQDFAFFNSADAHIDTVDGVKYIIFTDGYSVASYKFIKYYEMK